MNCLKSMLHVLIRVDRFAICMEFFDSLAGHSLGFATASSRAGRRHPEPACRTRGPGRPDRGVWRRARSRRAIRRPPGPSKSPAQWWTAAASAVRAALASAGATGEQVVGIGLDCTACTVVACDASGTPLRPALLWMDQRAFAEAEAISATGDPVLRYVSGRVSPEWMLPKALWLKRHEPEIFERAARIVECTDWMMHELTGEWTLSLNHVAVKWNYARPDGGWPRGLMAAVGLDDLLGEVAGDDRAAGRGDGRLSARAAADLGLKAGTPVAQGGIDAYLGMLGMGATGDGDVAVIVGSSTCHLAQSQDRRLRIGRGGLLSRRDCRGLVHRRGGPNGDRARSSTGIAATSPARNKERRTGEA